MPKPKNKRKTQIDLIPKLFRFHPILMAKVIARIKRDEEKLKAKRSANLTALTANLLDAWADERIDPWKR